MEKVLSRVLTNGDLNRKSQYWALLIHLRGALMPHSLFDIPGLEGLGRACRRFNVQFTAFGGLIRRYLVWDEKNDETTVDLFDLTPFLSDIDLVHTGGPELTPHIYRFLQTDIPFAECFRWELRSVEENAPFFQAMQSNGIIPVNLMSLATNAGLDDPWHGLRDIQNKKYRYIRNGFYPQSPLAREGRDLEFFSVLLYFRTLFEMGVSAADFRSQPGWEDAREVINDPRIIDIWIALQESAYLRSRLRYLLKSLNVASAAQSELEEVYLFSGLGSLLESFDRFCPTGNFSFEEPVPEGGYRNDTKLVSDQVLTSSGRIGGDFFRIPHKVGPWKSGDEAASTLEEMLAKPPIEPTPGSDATDYGGDRSLADGQDVLLASPLMMLTFGVAASSWLNQSTADEFLHFAVPTTGEAANSLRKVGERNLAVVLAMEATNRIEGNAPRAIFFPLTSACSLKSWGETLESDGILLTIRINAGALPEIAHKLFSRWRGSPVVSLRIFVLGWSHEAQGEEAE